MYRFLLSIIVLTFFLSCGGTMTIDANQPPTTEDKAIEQLRQAIFSLQGTVAHINAFTENDFSSCSASLPPLEVKICQIAQTATAEQQLLFISQLREMTSMFQNSLYGEDCVDEATVDCPAADSIVSDIAELESDVAINQLDIDAIEVQVAAIAADLATVESDVAALESRLDDFDGSGNSIETVISGVASDLADLESRVTELEDVTVSDKVFQAIALCEDIGVSGPVYESILLSGDGQRITAYIETGNKSGLGLLKEYGDAQGDMYASTTLNTRKCNFKVYENDSILELVVCWNNNNRKASESSIDAECDSTNDFASMTANCTCKP